MARQSLHSVKALRAVLPKLRNHFALRLLQAGRQPALASGNKRFIRCFSPVALYPVMAEFFCLIAQPVRCPGGTIAGMYFYPSKPWSLSFLPHRLPFVSWRDSHCEVGVMVTSTAVPLLFTSRITPSSTIEITGISGSGIWESSLSMFSRLFIFLQNYTMAVLICLRINFTLYFRVTRSQLISRRQFFMYGAQ